MNLITPLLIHEAESGRGVENVAMETHVLNLIRKFSRLGFLFYYKMFRINFNTFQLLCHAVSCRNRAMNKTPFRRHLKRILFGGSAAFDPQVNSSHNLHNLMNYSFKIYIREILFRNLLSFILFLVCYRFLTSAFNDVTQKGAR